MTHISEIEQYIGSPIDTSKLASFEGWDYEVDIYNNLVYRFPKSIEKFSHIQKEKQILDIVAKYVSLPVPNYTLVKDSFIVYPEIKGVSLESLDIGYTDEVLVDIVNFLKQLHSIPLSEVSFLEEKKEKSEENQQELIAFVNGLKTRIGTKLQGLVSQDTMQNLYVYMDKLFFDYTSTEKALVHTDIQAKNIIYNIDTKKISGIIDFTDSRIGGIELDFCYFYNQGENLLHKVISMYRGFDDQELFDRIAFLAKRGVLFEIDNDEVFNKDPQYILGQLKKYGFM